MTRKLRVLQLQEKFLLRILIRILRVSHTHGLFSFLNIHIEFILLFTLRYFYNILQL